MAQYPVGPLHFEAESFGDPGRPAVVLVMGLGMQLIAWPLELVQPLVDAGYRVVRFDNRDVGLSSKIDDAPKVNLLAEAARFFLRLPLKSAYTIRTMADDLAGLLDAMGIEKAHLVGASMGGMISQTFAAAYPHRTLSLASIMSSSGCRSLPTPRLRVLKLLLAAPPKRATFEQLVQAAVKLFRALTGPRFPVTDAELTERCTRSIRRSYAPAGTGRQMLAIAASGDRSDDLRRIATPTLVLHGDADPLLPPPHGRDCVKKIPGASLTVIPGMGHDLPPTLVPVLRDALLAHLKRTGS